MSKLSIIIPCYYNEQNIPITGRALINNEKKFQKGVRFEYVFVDDGSKDKTFQALKQFQKRYPNKITLIKLSRNFGSSNATMAGLSQASGDCIAILAADLQDPPELLPKMYAYWKKGTKLVVANRISRHDGVWTDLFSTIFHEFMQRFILRNIPHGGFDLMLFDKQIKNDLLAVKEKNFFFPYLIMWLGYDYTTIPYARRKRLIGTSQWTFAKRVKTFIDSFVSFTYLPLRVISLIGIILSIAALFYALLVIYGRLANHIPVEGWTSLIIILLFVSSFEMIALGIIGEYLWRTLDAARGRPPYIIEKVYKGR